MKFRFLGFFVVAVCILVSWATNAVAQDTTISANQFWSRLSQTEKMLTALQSETDTSAARDQIRSLWQDVSHIQFSDGQQAAVDIGWIRAALTDGNESTLEALHSRIRALLAYHENQFDDPAIQTNPSMASLAEVLQDPRFRYPDFTPTPIPDVPQLEVAQSASVSGLAQIILIVAGIAVVILVIVYFARNLQVQQASIESFNSDDPTSSADAQNLANDHAQTQDYRSAIRYLYLACLLMLDERGVIHYDSALTNREHLRRITDKPQVHDLLRRVINAFEEVWYGYLPIDDSYYQQFRQQVDELYRVVAR